MHKGFFGLLYYLNVIFQATFTLLTPPALLFVLAWLLVNKAGAPSWIYVIAIMLGVLTGLFSMIKFVISASSSIERLQNQNRKNDNEK